jgi:hypothetical protein
MSDGVFEGGRFAFSANHQGGCPGIRNLASFSLIASSESFIRPPIPTSPKKTTHAMRRLRPISECRFILAAHWSVASSHQHHGALKTVPIPFEFVFPPFNSFRSLRLIPYSILLDFTLKKMASSPFRISAASRPPSILKALRDVELAFSNRKHQTPPTPLPVANSFSANSLTRENVSQQPQASPLQRFVREFPGVSERLAFGGKPTNTVPDGMPAKKTTQTHTNDYVEALERQMRALTGGSALFRPTAKERSIYQTRDHTLQHVGAQFAKSNHTQH